MSKGRIIAMVVFAVMIVAGLLCGDGAKTFQKAVKICLECIGIG